jgi:hypothetical protein
MGQPKGFITPEERARITELQDLLIDRFVEHKEAVAAGEEERVKALEVLESDLIVAAVGTKFQVTETSRGLGGAKYWG